VKAYWAKVSDVFEACWIPDPDQKPGERLAYLQGMRGEQRRNVVFQGLFLMALGRLGFEMGQTANWDPEHEVLDRLNRLSPSTVEYDAVRVAPNAEKDFFYTKDGKKEKEKEKEKEKVKLQKVDRWANAMMKQSVDEAGTVVGYTFNNTRENLEATFRALCILAEFKPLPREPKPEDDAEVDLEAAA
jgi:hypothetical protein